ncbi:MAG: ACP S-malonyltransferase [Rickettsiaceae bacterium]|nr:ACP S-malonyltransferase [Rickettsiaceae bacterium]
MNRAFIFPGQGSQTIGMGKDIFDHEPIAKNVFEILDKTLKRPLSEIIFHGQDSILADTINTQPAIMATSIAILKTIMHYSGKNIEELCSIVAGHSLGEYSALCANGVLSLEQTITLLEIRANSMKTACDGLEVGMAACIGVELNILQAIIDELLPKGGICQIANDNVIGQIVISGEMQYIDLIITQLQEKNYRVIKLNVSGAFHCALMKPAEHIMKQAILSEKFNNPKVPIISNINAELATDIDVIKDNLLKQICGTVKWRQTMDQLATLGINELVEIGPGKILSNLAKKSGHNFNIYTVSNLSDIKEFLRYIK